MLRYDDIQKPSEWEKEKAKSKAPGYMIYFLLIVCIVYICDEVASQIGTQMQSVIASQLFAPIVGEEFAVARMSALSVVTIVVMLFSFLYKPLSDRYADRTCYADAEGPGDQGCGHGWE